MVTGTALQDLSIRSIAALIRADWGSKGKGVGFAAAPYLDAMGSMDSIDDSYFSDDGHMIVRYFLGNAGGYRGEQAREIKAELKRRLG